MATALAQQGAQTIATALNLLGPDGSRWIRGEASQVDPTRGGYDYCVVGALIAAAPSYEAYESAYNAVKTSVGGNIARWNNRAATDFADVQHTMREAQLSLLEG